MIENGSFGGVVIWKGPGGFWDAGHVLLLGLCGGYREVRTL